MKAPRRTHALGFLLGASLLLNLVGCNPGTPATISEEIGKSQTSAADAWAKAKADGTDKRTTKQATVKSQARGAVNRPGG